MQDGQYKYARKCTVISTMSACRHHQQHCTPANSRFQPPLPTSKPTVPSSEPKTTTFFYPYGGISTMTCAFSQAETSHDWKRYMVVFAQAGKPAKSAVAHNSHLVPIPADQLNDRHCELQFPTGTYVVSPQDSFCMGHSPPRRLERSLQGVPAGMLRDVPKPRISTINYFFITIDRRGRGTIPPSILTDHTFASMLPGFFVLVFLDPSCPSNILFTREPLRVRPFNVALGLVSTYVHTANLASDPKGREA